MIMLLIICSKLLEDYMLLNSCYKSLFGTNILKEAIKKSTRINLIKVNNRRSHARHNNSLLGYYLYIIICNWGWY